MFSDLFPLDITKTTCFDSDTWDVRIVYVRPFHWHFLLDASTYSYVHNVMFQRGLRRGYRCGVATMKYIEQKSRFASCMLLAKSSATLPEFSVDANLPKIHHITYLFIMRQKRSCVYAVATLLLMLS